MTAAQITSPATSSTATAHATLRWGLLANAALSLGTGLLFAIAGPTVSAWLGMDQGGLIRLLGAALIGHGVMLVWASGQDNIATLGRLNLATIAPYPLILIGLIIGGVIDRNLGIGLALADAAAVGLLAIVQFVGLRSHR